MAVRANLLEINDLENGIRQCTKFMENLQLFEMSQTITEEEKKEVAEERRKTIMTVERFEAYIWDLEKENAAFTLIYLFIILLVVLLRCSMYLASDWPTYEKLQVIEPEESALLPDEDTSNMESSLTDTQ